MQDPSIHGVKPTVAAFSRYALISEAVALAPPCTHAVHCFPHLKPSYQMKAALSSDIDPYFVVTWNGS